MSGSGFITESTNKFLAVSFVVSGFLALVTNFCCPLIREQDVCAGGGEFCEVDVGRWCRKLMVSMVFHRIRDYLCKALGE